MYSKKQKKSFNYIINKEGFPDAHFYKVLYSVVYVCYFML